MHPKEKQAVLLAPDAIHSLSISLRLPLTHWTHARRACAGLLAWCCFLVAAAQESVQPAPRHNVTITAVDETEVAIPEARISVYEPGRPVLRLSTDYAGRCSFQLEENQPYRIRAEKAGFYQADKSGIAPDEASVRIELAHQQIVSEQVNVTASTPGIDTQQASDQRVMNTPEIVNIPYVTSRDIRFLLPFYPGVVQTTDEQVHVDGSETWETLDTIDGFDVRSPVNGTLDARVSPDAVRSIAQEGTRYPVQYGRATGGVIAFNTGMGDNKFRFNATNFVPSFRNLNGWRFDKFVPRFTFSGPIRRDKAWWYDGVELEWDNIYVIELPVGANTDELIRGSNLAKVQVNTSANNILTAGVLYNGFHSPHDGISALVPQESTVNQNITAWLPYVRDQWSFRKGALLDVGLGEMRFRDGFEPNGDLPYAFTPETVQGSFFESLTGRASRVQGTADLYLPTRQWLGGHDLRVGLDLDHITYNQDQTRAPVSYLREDRTLDRLTTFPFAPAFTLHNDEIGAYAEDNWKPAKGWLLEPGLRFDWDTIVRRPLVAPRLAVVYAPAGNTATTKISAGIGVYYEHTQLAYIAQPYAGMRYDTYYAANGVTPLGPAQLTVFTANNALLNAPRAINWSVALEHKLPWSIYGGASYVQKTTSNVFTFTNQNAPSLSGNYLLTNAREDHYRAEQVELRRLFRNGYTVYVAYTHSSARTNAALQYLPTPSPLGPQQSGPLPWNVPNRTISWGWLPFDVPVQWFKKNWDFVYTVDWRTGFPYTAVNAAHQVVGAAGAYRFPDYISISPGLEWRFHFRHAYYGLRGVIEDATNRSNSLVVNNVIDSPQFGTFLEPEGRAFTARIRLIGSR